MERISVRGRLQANKRRVRIISAGYCAFELQNSRTSILASRGVLELSRHWRAHISILPAQKSNFGKHFRIVTQINRSHGTTNKICRSDWTRRSHYTICNFDDDISATDANAALQQQQRIITLTNQATSTSGIGSTTTSTDAHQHQSQQQQHIIGKMSFVVPAPPAQAALEKVRRLSDSEHFRQPNVTIATLSSVGNSAQKQLQEAQTQAQAQALADMILKVGAHFSRSSVISRKEFFGLLDNVHVMVCRVPRK